MGGFRKVHQRHPNVGNEWPVTYIMLHSIFSTKNRLIYLLTDKLWQFLTIYLLWYTNREVSEDMALCYSTKVEPTMYARLKYCECRVPQIDINQFE